MFLHRVYSLEVLRSVQDTVMDGIKKQTYTQKKKSASTVTTKASLKLITSYAFLSVGIRHQHFLGASSQNAGKELKQQAPLLPSNSRRETDVQGSQHIRAVGENRKKSGIGSRASLTYAQT